METAQPHPLLILRALCLALPDAEEHESFGHPVYRAMGKTFAREDADNAPAVLVPTAPDGREMLLSLAPGRFFIPPIPRAPGVGGNAAG